jgi:hypothetical protein
MLTWAQVFEPAVPDPVPLIGISTHAIAQLVHGRTHEAIGAHLRAVRSRLFVLLIPLPRAALLEEWVREQGLRSPQPELQTRPLVGFWAPGGTLYLALSLHAWIQLGKGRVLAVQLDPEGGVLTSPAYSAPADPAEPEPVVLFDGGETIRTAHRWLIQHAVGAREYLW